MFEEYIKMGRWSKKCQEMIKGGQNEIMESERE